MKYQCCILQMLHSYYRHGGNLIPQKAGSRSPPCSSGRNPGLVIDGQRLKGVTPSGLIKEVIGKIA